MEEETYVVDNMSEHEGICQILFEAIEDQSEVCRRAEEATSDLLQSNQLRLGKSDGKPGTPLPATKSDRQSQKVGLGNPSLNSPTEVVGDMFHNLYCDSKCVPIDESGIWSILTYTLLYVKPEIDSSVTFSYDQRRHQNSKSKYFDAAFSNIPTIENNSIDQTFNPKKENFDAANSNVPNVPIYSQALFPKYEEDRYGNLSLFTTSVFKPYESICATYQWTEENKCSIMESEAYDLEGNNMWFKQGRFPIIYRQNHKVSLWMVQKLLCVHLPENDMILALRKKSNNFTRKNHCFSLKIAAYTYEHTVDQWMKQKRQI